jgi:hypothetical protein
MSKQKIYKLRHTHAENVKKMKKCAHTSKRFQNFKELCNINLLKEDIRKLSAAFLRPFSLLPKNETLTRMLRNTYL